MLKVLFQRRVCVGTLTGSSTVFSRGVHTSSSFSHIIVGGGSAGCVLANRLSAIPSNSVLLLEAGPSDRDWNFWKIYMPAALTYNLTKCAYNWGYETTPQKHMFNRRLYHPRGKVLGGSSCLNAMVYIRGHAFDYDRWSNKEGCEGWSYAECLPYFRRSETFPGGSDTYRGRAGPLLVSWGSCDNALHQAFLAAGSQAGYPSTDDVNGYQQDGFGRYQMTIGKGRRSTTAAAYLYPALKTRSSLKVLTHALAERVLIENGRATGVEFSVKNGPSEVAQCRGQVILSGGAFNSPQLLMLSGIGEQEALKNMGIEVKQNLPGVGQNLQDHLEFYAQWECLKPITLLNSLKLHNMLRIGIQWFLTQTGEGASSHLESGAFTKSRPEMTHPDIQWHFLPGLVEDHGRAAANFHAFQLHIGTLRPMSSGYVSLRSKNPRDYVVVEPNYLGEKQDIVDLRECVRQARQVVEQAAFDPYRGKEIKPGPQATSDEAIDDFLRKVCESAYHPSCTCKMGPSADKMAVVDPKSMNVWGMDNLKVVDASVMPSVVSGNLNGPTVMLAEKAADILLGNPPLTAQKVPVYGQSV